MTPNLIRSVSAACLAAVLLPAQQEEEVVVELKPRIVKSAKVIKERRSGALIAEIAERLADSETSAKDRKALKKKLLALIGDVKADALVEVRPIIEQGQGPKGKVKIKGKKKGKNKRKVKRKGKQRIVFEQPGERGGVAYLLESADGDNLALVQAEAKQAAKQAMEQARKALAQANIEIGDLSGIAEVHDIDIDVPHIHIPQIDAGKLKALLKGHGKGDHFVFEGSNLDGFLKGANGKKNGFTFKVDGAGKGLEGFFTDGKKGKKLFRFDGEDEDVQVWLEDSGKVRKITRSKKGPKGKGGIWSVQGPKDEGALLRLVERAKAHAQEAHEHEVHEHEVHEHEEIFEEVEEVEEAEEAEEMMEMIEEMRAEMRELREMMEEIRNSLRGSRSRTRGRSSNRRVGQVVPLSTREERLSGLAREVR